MRAGISFPARSQFLSVPAVTPRNFAAFVTVKMCWRFLSDSFDEVNLAGNFGSLTCGKEKAGREGSFGMENVLKVDFRRRKKRQVFRLLGSFSII